MTTPPVTPVPGLVSEIEIGGTAVMVIPPGPNGGYITNPPNPADQGIGGGTEPLYVDPVSPPGLNGNGTTSSLAPGQSYSIIPGQTNPVYVNAATSGHKFTCVWY